jgi:hypothetical protein
MDEDQHIWRSWASFLQRWGVEQWAASALEVAGPLSVLGAQAVYLSSPLLRNVLPVTQLDALARMLEDRGQTQAFANYLREAPAAHSQ